MIRSFVRLSFVSGALLLGAAQVVEAFHVLADPFHGLVPDGYAIIAFGYCLTCRLVWWESEGELKLSTLASYHDAFDLYFRPGLGHVRLADLRDHHFRDLYALLGSSRR